MIPLTIGAIVVICVIILFNKKKRFPKKFKPYQILKKDDFAKVVGMPPIKQNLTTSFDRHPINILKPEEARILVDLTPLNIGIASITVKLRAEDATHVVITNLADLNLVIPTATLGGITIATLAAHGPTCSISIFGPYLKISGHGNTIEVHFS